MAIKTVRCRVLQADITVLTDFEDNITQVICPAYDRATGVCSRKQSASSGGPLSTFVERLAEGTLNDRAIRCDYAS